MKTEGSFLYNPLDASVAKNVKYAYRWGNDGKTSRIPSTHKKKGFLSTEKAFPEQQDESKRESKHFSTWVI